MNSLRRLLDDQQGNVAIIVAFMLFPMLVLAGGATDIARYEMFRVQLQDGVDRAVIAAASLTQDETVEDTAAQYLKTVSFIDQVDLDYDYEAVLNARAVTITASYAMPTSFLPLIGIDSISMVATATAQEHKRNLEISLILDISGSMLLKDGRTVTRIGLLRPAAKQFVDTMITSATAPYTSLSIIPFAGTVNPGSVAFGLLGTTRRHTYSSCIEFDHTNNNRDYATGMVPFNLRQQVPHFTHNHRVPEAGKEFPYCPYEATSVTYLSNDAAALKARIDSLKLHDGTGTGVATNWGYLLLDPSAQPFVSRMATAGQLPMQFSNRPAAFDSHDTLKVLVLMTDGEISAQQRPTQYDFPRAEEGKNSLGPEYQGVTSAWASMQKVCRVAKANGVIVYTISFHVNHAELRNCASSANHYFYVTGSGIDLAFAAVANSIQNLKLTQ